MMNGTMASTGRLLNAGDAWVSVVNLKRRDGRIESIQPTYTSEMVDIVASGRVYESGWLA